MSLSWDHRTLQLRKGKRVRAFLSIDTGTVEIALKQAGEKTKGVTLASDGFFSFDDPVRTVAKAGIMAIIQAGGSSGDEDSIKGANELGVVMSLTGIRHSLH